MTVDEAAESEGRSLRRGDLGAGPVRPPACPLIRGCAQVSAATRAESLKNVTSVLEIPPLGIYPKEIRDPPKTEP